MKIISTITIKHVSTRYHVSIVSEESIGEPSSLFYCYKCKAHFPHIVTVTDYPQQTSTLLIDLNANYPPQETEISTSTINRAVSFIATYYSVLDIDLSVHIAHHIHNTIQWL